MNPAAKNLRGRVIFDFDGTIADTMKVALECANQVLTKRKLGILDDGLLEEYRSLGARHLQAKLGLGWWSTFWVIKEVKQLISRQISHISIFPEITHQLYQLKEAGLELALVTSNRRDIVEAFLLKEGLKGLFSSVICDVGLFKKKSAFKKVLLKEPRLPRNLVVSVGDEARDVWAAKSLGMVSVAVSWGYQNEESLKNAQPNLVLSHRSELANRLLQIL